MRLALPQAASGRSAAAVLALLALALATTPALATNGAKITASGTRAGGRGGTDTAVADDATALNTNPAGIGFIDGQRLDTNLAVFVPHLRWQNAVDDVRSAQPSIGAIVGGSFGFVFDFEEPWKLGEALSFGEETFSETPPRSTPDYAGLGLKLGFGLFPLGGSHIAFDARSPHFDQKSQSWNTELKEVAWTLGIGWRILHWLSVGISPQLITGLPGYKQLDNDQPVTQPKEILQGHPTGTSGITYSEAAPFLGLRGIEGFAEMMEMRTFGFRLRVGALLVPIQWETGQLSVGLSYATQSFKQDYLGKARVDFTNQINKVDPDGTLLKPTIAANTGIPEDQQTYVGEWNLRLNPLDAPQELSAGIAVQAFSRLLLALDVTWINWSATEEKLDGRLTNGTSRELNELTGDDSGTTKIDFPLDWKDQVVVATGISVAALDWLTLRAGYNYGANPVPARTLQPTLPAFFEHHVSVGASFYIRRVEIALGYEHTFEQRVHIDGSDANFDVENSDVSGSLDVFALGLGLRF